MAESKFVRANEMISEKVVSGYKKVEDAVVGGYKAMEDAVVEGYKTVEYPAIFAELGALILEVLNAVLWLLAGNSNHKTFEKR